MLKRKIQISGKGSFILTLPMHMILALGLKKGTDLRITLEKGSILLTPIIANYQEEGSSAPVALAGRGTEAREQPSRKEVLPNV